MREFYNSRNPSAASGQPFQIKMHAKMTKTMRNIATILATSALVCPGMGFRPLYQRIRFFFRSIVLYHSISPLLEASPESPLGELMAFRPQTIGAAIWPYQCSAWDARTRFERIRNHYAVVEKIGIANFPVDSEIALLDLGEIRDGLRIVIDQPIWFMREGQLSFNLFLGTKRIYTIAFSLFQDGSSIGALVGAIQGRDIDGALDLYRDLTKSSQGMRPRDLLFETFRMFCSEIGVNQILAVSDAFRHHRDQEYFGKTFKKASANYDEIWTERGGVRFSPTFFELKVTEPEKDLSTVPAKKRSMYRRRLEMLRRIKSQLHEKCDGHLTKPFVGAAKSCSSHSSSEQF